MSIKDFQDCFWFLFVCKYHDDYEFCAQPLPVNEEGFFIIHMTVEEAGDYTIGVSQKGYRCFDEDSGYEHVPCKLILGKEGKEGGLQFIKDNKTYHDRDTYLEV